MTEACRAAGTKLSCIWPTRPRFNAAARMRVEGPAWCAGHNHRAHGHRRFQSLAAYVAHYDQDPILVFGANIEKKSPPTCRAGLYTLSMRKPGTSTAGGTSLCCCCISRAGFKLRLQHIPLPPLLPGLMRKHPAEAKAGKKKRQINKVGTAAIRNSET